MTTINTDNINRVIDRIEREPDHRFDMAQWCGTAACIGGWCEILLHEDAANRMLPSTASNLDAAKDALVKKLDQPVLIDDEQVHEFLGITFDEAEELFYPGAFFQKTKPVALECLRHLRDTGEIDWSRALRVVNQRQMADA